MWVISWQSTLSSSFPLNLSLKNIVFFELSQTPSVYVLSLRMRFSLDGLQYIILHKLPFTSNVTIYTLFQERGISAPNPTIFVVSRNRSAYHFAYSVNFLFCHRLFRCTHHRNIFFDIIFYGIQNFL